MVKALTYEAIAKAEKERIINYYYKFVSTIIDIVFMIFQTPFYASYLI